MWTAILYVTSGLALMAFITACGVWVYRRHLLNRESLIKSAPKNRRAELIKDLPFPIDTKNLPPDRMYDLAIAQIKERTQKSRMRAFVAVILGAFFLTGAIVAMIKTKSEIPKINSPVQAENTVNTTIEVGKSTSPFNGALTITLKSTRLNPDTGKYHVTASVKSPGTFDEMEISDGEVNNQIKYTYWGQGVFDILVLSATPNVAKFSVIKRAS